MDNQIEQFLKHCKNEKSLSDKTIKFYRIDLIQFKNYLLKNNIVVNLEKIDRNIIRDYIECINSFMPKTIKRKLATLKSFFCFCEYEEIILITPFRKLKLKIKEPLQCPKTITREQVVQILKYAHNYNKEKNTLESIRNVIVIELLFSTGIRVSELSNLKLCNVCYDSKSIKVYGKGSKERIIHVSNNEVFKLINNYTNLIKEKNKIIEFLLINRDGNRLSDQSIRKIVKNNSKSISEKGYITPHTFRHSLATFLIESSIDISFVQKLLGHSSIITTQIYTHISQNKQNEVLSKFHPRNLMKIE